MAVTARVAVEDGVYVFEISGSPTTNDCALPVLQYRSVEGYSYNEYITQCYQYTENNASTLIGSTKWFLYPLDYRSEKTGTPYDINQYGVGWATGTVDSVFRQLRQETYRFAQAAMSSTGGNASDYYSNFYIPTATPLSTPTGLNADNITSDSARVSWTAVENASGYKVEYRRQGDTTWNE